MSSTILRGARVCQPWLQGELDALCGPYAAINALRVVLFPGAILNGRDSRRLLAAGLTCLSHDTRLERACVAGISSTKLYRLTRHLAERAERLGRCKLVVRRPPNKQWTRAKLLTTIDEAHGDGAAVIVGLGNRYDHFTVIVGVWGARYLLFDSGRMQWITRESIGTDKSKRRFRLAPSDVIIVKGGADSSASPAPYDGNWPPWAEDEPVELETEGDPITTPPDWLPAVTRQPPEARRDNRRTEHPSSEG
ncbi:hypothetical protein GI374_03110 [Paracoccus sp. S-4012]|uniref:hypothetical protein n=1 Tax=Paracoccus sp. S-4012 TaxID=2665648 RepID=UPI0012B15E6F|nr:hypothetical protein [Paracoccus sp. S-4012]MRX49451.1 hypothetical protein [Paracoccus sp. S-4012]